MQPKSTSSTMLAKGPLGGTGASTRSSRATSEDKPLLAADADPEATVDKVLALLSEQHYPMARRLAAEARVRFPDHSRVQDLWSIFDNRGKAIAGPEASEPSREEEFEWLRHPPESARGKWVALLGSEMIAAAEKLVELEESLRSKQLPKPALVHYID